MEKNNDLTVHVGTNLIQPRGQTQAKNWHSVSALKENLGGKWERGSGLANIDYLLIKYSISLSRVGFVITVDCYYTRSIPQLSGADLTLKTPTTRIVPKWWNSSNF